MVRLSAFRFAKPFWNKKRSMLDSMRITAKGGTGGHGLPNEKGQGGKGGNVLLECQPTASLEKVQHKNPSKIFKAPQGKDSKLYDLMGSCAPDLKICVPPGISVHSETGATLGHLNKPLEQVLLARGGEGGCQDNGWIGQPGESITVTLDLKLLADVGLVGFPNAGKSTLLTVLSRAKPKIANYPFTTLAPNLGTIEYPNLRKISVADLPGLIEGAHINYGLGHQFLKHVVRTKVLLFVVDITGFQFKSDPYRTAFETLLLLNQELELYQESLLDKPALLAVNKMDRGLKENTRLFQELRQKWTCIREVSQDLDPKLCSSRYIHFHDMVPLSAGRKAGVDILKQKILETIDHYHGLRPLETPKPPKVSRNVI